MTHPERRIAVVLGFLWVVTTGAHAQSRPPTAAQEPPRFKSGVEVVALDVTVVDRKGVPVAGLTASDFTVTVDSKPRRVASAQFISSRATATTSGPASKLPDATATAPPPASPAATSRDVIIVIDEDSIETEDGLAARRAALSFLDRLNAADRVGVNTIPRLRANFSVTNDRAESRKAIGNWVPGAYSEPRGQYWIGVAEAYDITANDQTVKDKVFLRECDDRRTGRISQQCAREIVAEARQITARSSARGTHTLEALRTLGRGLRQIAGPKTVVLMSGGILRPESVSSFADVEAEFAAAQITLYTLFFEKSEYDGKRQSPTLGEDDRFLEDGLANVTSAAGGTFLRVIGTVETFFTRVATELSASYLLGIEAEPADRDGRPHQVSIKVKRRGLDVHGRKQYVIPARAK